MEVTIQPSMPQKVLVKARQLGVHNDCLIAGDSGCCAACQEHITMAFDFFYGHLESRGELLIAIIDDLFVDGDEDQSWTP